MSYKIHHLNCGTMCGGDKPLLRSIMPQYMVCHCLLIETHQGLVLVDTGFGMAEIQQPHKLGKMFLLASDPQLKIEETAVKQIEKLGYKTADVSDIIVTHLHLDHAGGIRDFPEAKVHVYRPEYEVAQHPSTLLEKGGYLPYQWRYAQWAVHDTSGEKWMGFDAVQAFESNNDILIVPLTGHSKGHSGIAVNSKSGWILHCGDAYFNQSEINPVHPSGPFGLKVFQSLINTDKAARLNNQERLRKLNRDHGDKIRLICSHDYDDFCNCSNTSAV